ncbi:hypothetical protein GALMADRAFT_144267 [Galerina marginata CBS 339.88]|uniref:Uncharacterized protein n=1 Tax=Galerina marginata (strain CBS 339.88) TaxID=685588 RepID=A0A067SIN3_GALM3|nr:hypothetical protein GALMADRAFT_144267 [Galerina marginata CBS 339.88]
MNDALLFAAKLGSMVDNDLNKLFDSDRVEYWNQRVQISYAPLRRPILYESRSLFIRPEGISRWRNYGLKTDFSTSKSSLKRHAMDDDEISVGTFPGARAAFSGERTSLVCLGVKYIPSLPKFLRQNGPVDFDQAHVLSIATARMYYRAQELPCSHAIPQANSTNSTSPGPCWCLGLGSPSDDHYTFVKVVGTRVVHAFQPRRWAFTSSPLKSKHCYSLSPSARWQREFSVIVSSLKPWVVALRIELLSQSSRPSPPIATYNMNEYYLDNHHRP